MRDFEVMVLKIAAKATREAQERNRKMGIANVYSKNGQPFFQLPDGTITQEEPEEYKKVVLK
ncbi:hypothetical protein MNB_SM-7-291 [hydrothermal vent metagenome]|uniref:Uncharacterized protein n=1 Tax=hydrothermal vent metagenome TaxID=652676 RepID=A0A1W1BCU7_9ZZZZ